MTNKHTVTLPLTDEKKSRLDEIPFQSPGLFIQATRAIGTHVPESGLETAIAAAMTAPRTREEQIAHLESTLSEAMPPVYASGCAERHILEAEQRGYERRVAEEKEADEKAIRLRAKLIASLEKQIAKLKAMQP